MGAQVEQFSDKVISKEFSFPSPGCVCACREKTKKLRTQSTMMA